MERRMKRKFHVRCEAGENLEITSKSYLSLQRGNWQETLPDIAQEIKIVNLTSEDKNRGLLDPYVIMKRTKDAESLAIDILTFLTGISSRDGEKFPVLRRAIRSVTVSYTHLYCLEE